MEAMRNAWTDDRMDDLAKRMDLGFAQAEARTNRFEDQVDARFERVEAGFDRMDARFDRMEARFEKVDERFEKVDERFEKVDARFERFEDRMSTRFEWLWRLMLAGYVAAVLGSIFG
jgi:archaellum component FlaC